MGTRFYGAKILSLADMRIKSGEVWTYQDRIAYVGVPKEIPKGVRFDREIDLKGNLIMPSFKNAHTHSAMTFLRSFADDMPLNDWLFQQVFPMEAKLTGEDVYWLTRLAHMEYLSSGITSCFDMYFEPEYVAKAAVDSSFRTVMCGSVSGSDSKSDIDSALYRLEHFYDTYNKYDDSGLVSYKLGFHAEYTTDIEIIKGIAQMAKKHRQPVYTHNSETKSEVEGCIERHGKTPTELFEECGLFEFGGGGFHCVHMTQNDLDIIKRRNLWVVTNPASNCKLASGIAPLSKMLDMEINLAIGTDGAASNNALDMFREMYLATVLQKLLRDDASAMPANKVLEMACSGSAQAMGLSDCDALLAGKKADLMVLDLRQPNMQPQNNIIKNIVYSGSKKNVLLTMSDGKILYENGEYTTCDADEIYAKSNAIMKRLAK